jgi:hypothetical protein
MSEDERITLTVGELKALVAEAVKEAVEQALAERAEAEKALEQKLADANVAAAAAESGWEARVAEMAKVEMIPEESETLFYQGVPWAVIGGQVNLVPAAHAAVYQEARRQRAEVARLEEAMSRKVREQPEAFGG